MALDISIAVIGCGFSGMCAVIMLKRAGFADITVFEASDGIGGTWKQNTYPGCACDVPSVLYCFSFEQFLPAENFSSQQDILSYQHHCMDKYGLWQHVRLRARVTSATFEESGGTWTVTTVDGQKTVVQCLIIANGLLNTPRIPRIPGLATFTGTAVHTAAWDHTFDLTGKRVAVVGTGASAIQVVPNIQKQAEQLYVFQRSAAWVLNRSLFVSPGLVQWATSRFNLCAQLLRWWLFWFYDLVLGWTITTNNRLIMGLLEMIALRGMRCHIRDPKLRRQLTPNYPIACKRALMSDDYYPAMAQSNVQLVPSAVKQISGSTISAEDGKAVQVDAIIWATGFDVSQPLRSIDIRGLGGRTLADTLAAKPQVYLGVAVAGFPNMFTVLGPNTYLGHNSMIFMMECTTSHIVKVLQWMASKHLKWVNVKEQVQDEYNAELKPRYKHTPWLLGGCSSWYLDAGGSSSEVLWPGLCIEFKHKAEKFSPEDWHAAEHTANAVSAAGTVLVARLASPAAGARAAAAVRKRAAKSALDWSGA